MVMSYDKKLRCGVFIDYSNVLWGSLEMLPEERWFIDYEKLKAYLKQHYRPVFYKLYTAVDERPKSQKFIERARIQVKMNAKLEGMGYDVITKPLKYIKQGDGTFKTKGDMDIELSMDMMGALNDLDTVVLISGDCDYLKPVQTLHVMGKYIRIISFDKLLSWELRTFAMRNARCSFATIDSLKEQVRYEKVLTYNKAKGRLPK